MEYGDSLRFRKVDSGFHFMDKNNQGIGKVHVVYAELQTEDCLLHLSSGNSW